MHDIGLWLCMMSDLVYCDISPALATLTLIILLSGQAKFAEVHPELITLASSMAEFAKAHGRSDRSCTVAHHPTSIVIEVWDHPRQVALLTLPMVFSTACLR